MTPQLQILLRATIMNASAKGEKRYVTRKGTLTLGNCPLPANRAEVLYEVWPGGRVVQWDGRMPQPPKDDFFGEESNL